MRPAWIPDNEGRQGLVVVVLSFVGWVEPTSAIVGSSGNYGLCGVRLFVPDVP